MGDWYKMDDLGDFFGPNAGYVLELYDKFLADPGSVDADTRSRFARWAPLDGSTQVATQNGHVAATRELSVANPRDVARITRLSHFARTIRTRGHLAARLDPLGSEPPGDPGLDLQGSGVSAEDLVELPPSVIRGPASLTARSAGEVIEVLQRIYCGTTGYDYAHVQDAEERDWIRDAVESGSFSQPMDAEAKRSLLHRLTEVEAFEAFLHRALPGQKRFSIEGTDMMVPMLDHIIQSAAASGTGEVVMGMAHRGRLNVLAHVLGKPYAQILSEFHRATSSPTTAPSEHFAHYGWTGDVKYHLGAQKMLTDGEDVRIHITLAPNPSHLEFVNPVIEGMTRALQERRDAPGTPTQDVNAALAILIHGDAAFPGEGVVAETLNLSQLAGYRTGGTINIIANNQLGFTTGPEDARSTLYASDLAKGFEIPIVHVNADDPEACLSAAKMSFAYRERFHKDFLIDLVGYRRWGHNEGDEPAFTQPLIYERMKAHPTVRAIWAAELDREGIVPLAESIQQLANAVAALQEILSNGVAENVPEERAEQHLAAVTAPQVSADRLSMYNEHLLALPPGFTVHPRLQKILQARADAVDGKGGIDWAQAESLAFASLLAEGTPIRLSGQDSERGTFSQRHSVLHDVVDGTEYVPLRALRDARASFVVYNSPLSEAAVLGFEYGYSVEATNTLLLWEAQFGDFANAGQVIIDQFISAARAKWRQHPWLVLLLPHGYEGQGPEHSSGRLERYLQIAGGENLRVCNCTTAAQYYHLLRRQVALRNVDARPLVLMTPKSLLRHPLATSRLEELAEGTFQPVLDDQVAQSRADLVTRLVLCTGKVYIDLISSAERAEADRVAIARVEQLYPFPDTELTAVLSRYRNLREVVWLQEEPRNMGAWSYLAPRLRDLIGRDPAIDYIGRPDRASPAEGSPHQHQIEQARIVAEAFSGLQGPPAPPTQAQGVKQHAR
jgi:2-oxoglutarate dehydrogenase E1 component